MSGRQEPLAMTPFLLPHLRAWLRAHVRSERGANLVEYALLVALIAAVCIAAVTSYGGTLSRSFSRAGQSVEVAGT